MFASLTLQQMIQIIPTDKNRKTGKIYPKSNCPDSKVHGTNMGSIWGRQDPGGPHVGPMNFAIWVVTDR